MSTGISQLTSNRGSRNVRGMRPQNYSRRKCAGWIDPAGEVLLDRWALTMRAEAVSEKTIELRVGAVRLCARHSGRSVDDLRPDDVRAWLADYPNANTKSSYHAAVMRFYVWLVAEQLREKNPLSVMRPPRVPRGTPRPCASADLEAAIAAAEPRDRAMLTLGAYQGLRRAEVARVRGEDLDLVAGTLTVLGKGGVRAVLPLHAEVVKLAGRMPRLGWWFPSRCRPGQPVTPQIVSAAVRKACRAAGVPEFTSHPLRHWFGTSLVRSGTDLRTTQTLMRHASLATTARYVEVEDSARRDAMLRLPTLGHP